MTQSHVAINQDYNVCTIRLYAYILPLTDAAEAKRLRHVACRISLMYLNMNMLSCEVLAVLPTGGTAAAAERWPTRRRNRCRRPTRLQSFHRLYVCVSHLMWGHMVSNCAHSTRSRVRRVEDDIVRVFKATIKLRVAFVQKLVKRFRRECHFEKFGITTATRFSVSEEPYPPAFFQRSWKGARIHTHTAMVRGTKSLPFHLPFDVRTVRGGAH